MSFLRFFSRRRHDADLTQEIQDHIAQETADNIARGMNANEARRRAYVKFGNPQVVRETLWSQNTLTWLDGLWRDLRYAARTLRRSPGFSLISVFVMALGIGGTVAMFTIVRSVLLNPLPYRNSERLYTLYERNPKDEQGDFMPVAAGSFDAWQKSAGAKAEMALVSPWQSYNVSAEGGKLPEKVDAGWVSWNFFQVLGVQPALGRNFTESDDQSAATATVVLSYGFWKRRYNGDPHVLGKNIYLDATPFTVIGVLPEWFSYSTAMSANTQQVWTPVRHEAPLELLQAVDDHNFLAVARLADGVSLQQLLSQLNTVQQQIKATHPGPSVHAGVNGHSMLDDAVAHYKTPLYVLLSATCCLLLIACLNVASLLVARVSARSKEHAIRAAMGGSRLRLMRERFTESLVLSITGGAAGLLFAWGALRWLVATRTDMNRIETVHLDLWSVLFAVTMVALAAMFAAFISSLSTDRKPVLTALQESSRSYSAGSARAMLRRVLLAAEVTLTVVLLVGAGLLLKSYQRMRNTDLGIPTDNVLTLTMSLPEARYDHDKPAAFFEQLLTRVRALPGVQAAGLVSRAPGQGWGGDSMVTVVEHPPLPQGVGLDFMRRAADPGYFAAVHLPLIKGRVFRDDERGPRGNVVVLSEQAAKLAFPNNEDPIGKHVRVQLMDEHVFEIIGVVGDVRWKISEPPMPALYMPISIQGWTFATLMVRAPRNVESLALPVQKVIGELDPDLPVFDVRTLQETIARSTMASQFDSLLVLAFAVMALVLAAAGLYGVVAYLVTQRTAEIGVRIALGAQREQVLTLILKDGLRPAVLGVVFGLGASAATARLIRSMLYETAPFDPLVFATVVVALLAMAGLACLVPAWKASRLDPMQALRTE